MRGLEPRLHRVKVHCLTDLATSQSLVSHAFIQTARIWADSQPYGFYTLELLHVARFKDRVRFELTDDLTTVVGFQDRYNKPLCHLSKRRASHWQKMGRRCQTQLLMLGVDSQKRVKSNQHHYNNTDCDLCQPLGDIFFFNLKIPLQLL